MTTVIRGPGFILRGNLRSDMSRFPHAQLHIGIPEWIMGFLNPLVCEGVAYIGELRETNRMHQQLLSQQIEAQRQPKRTRGVA